MAILAGSWRPHRHITGFCTTASDCRPRLPRFNGYLLVRSGVLAAEGGPADVFAALTRPASLGWVAQNPDRSGLRVVYVTAIRPKLPWSNSARGNLAKALLWGLVLATISALCGRPRSSRVPRRILQQQPRLERPWSASTCGTSSGSHVALIYNPLPAEELAVASSTPVDVDVTRSSLARA